MPTLRLVVAGRGRLVRDLAQAMARARPYVQLVDEVLEPLALIVAVREWRAHAVALDVDDPALAGVASHLLGEFPDLAILGVGLGGVYIEQLCPRRVVPSGRSPAEILSALAGSLRGPCE